MASRFGKFSEEETCAINEGSRTNKYQESDELWLVGARWYVENYFMLNLPQNRKMHLTKFPKCLLTVNKAPTK